MSQFCYIFFSQTNDIAFTLTLFQKYFVKEKWLLIVTKKERVLCQSA